LQQAARQEPGRISYGSLGNGHASQVAVETYASAAGLQLLHVPFKEAGALFSSVASGEVDFTAFGMNSVSGLMAAGKLRPLAVAARERLPSYPEIPTLAQAGGPPVHMHPWAALVAVAGTPAPVLRMLQQDIAAVLDSPEVRSRAGTAGFEITPSTPQAVLDRVQADMAQVRPLIAEGRLTQL
jgi:tripartite-type tricarboxylate transporter receptor subunit TctC